MRGRSCPTNFNGRGRCTRQSVGHPRSGQRSDSGVPVSGLLVTQQYCRGYFPSPTERTTAAGRRRTNSIAKAPAAAARIIHSLDSGCTGEGS